MKFLFQKQKGIIVINSLVFGVISILIITALTLWFTTSLRFSQTIITREQALQVAEAGIDYYRWHLAHNRTDYFDGTGSAGTYIHPFYDKNDVRIGQFELTITPPPIGSTIVTIKSVGKVDAAPGLKRIITEKLAIPSLARYAVASNSDIRFGQGTEVFGPIHSNGGIRFDGIAHNLITSSRSSYDDPDHSGGAEFGVHTHENNPGPTVNDTFRPLEAPPTNPVPSRLDVFMSGRQFPVPAYDFTGLTTDLQTIKTNAQASGKYFAPSGSLGYYVLLKNNNTYDVYRVTSLTAAPNNCVNSLNESGWGTWSVNNKVLVGNYTYPANGLIFFEDHLWIEGTINNNRLTIASAKFPDSAGTRTSITINNNLKYTNYNGQDTIGLIAQNNINVGLFSANTFEIDGALVAQNGRVGRYYYNPAFCGVNSSRAQLTLYGMIASNLRYGFAWTDGTGYAARILNYDANLLYGPPPSFPLTSAQYSIISWEENEN